MPHRGPCVAKLTLNYHCQVRRKVFQQRDAGTLRD
jgi:hypothetical protein